MSLPVIYDVAIVGAGPAGSTCAWYLAQQGLRVAVFERKRFPRDKICGDAAVTRRCTFVRWVSCRRLLTTMKAVSPRWVEWSVRVESATSTIRKDHLNSSPVIAIKRIFLDIRIAHAARDRKTRVMASSSAMKAAVVPCRHISQLDGGAPLLTGQMVRVEEGSDRRTGKPEGLQVKVLGAFVERVMRHR